METKSEKYFRRLVSGIASFFVTMSFYGWTASLHEENPWNTLFYMVIVAEGMYRFISNNIERERVNDLKKKKAKKESDEGEA